MGTEVVERIVDPTLATFIKLDDLMVKYDEVLSSQLKILAYQSKLLDIQTKNIIITQGNQKLLSLILKELRDTADDGDYITMGDTATTSKFTIIDTQKDPGHPVKSYTIFNDGKYSIYVGHNVALSSVGPDKLDANINNITNRFNLIKSGNHYNYSVNRQKIRNIYLLAAKGASQFRITLAW